MKTSNQSLDAAALETLARQALAPVQGNLEAVGALLDARLQDELIRRVAYLVRAGGKRLRPAAVLLCGQCGPNPDREGLIATAAAVELIHTATLIHDDIIDLSTLRRSMPAFHHNWGTERALLTGDYLYASAFSLLASLNRPALNSIVADICERLSLGELREVEARYRFDLDEAEYLDIIYGKTASLLEGCCRMGALLGGFGESEAARFAAFGRGFGLAFQIADDCLDLSGDRGALGKAVLEDLDKGTLSLPVIYLRESLPRDRREALFAPLRALLEQEDGRDAPGPAEDDRQRRVSESEPEFMRAVAAAARESGALERARRRAAELAEEAKRAIEPLALGSWGGAFNALADYAVFRRS